MKRYKLIKEYPGSPKLGKILKPKVETENNNTNNYYWEGSWFNPKDYPEFWQEVFEKDYEILSFTCNNKKLYYNKNLKSFNYENNDGDRHRTLEFILKNFNTYKIHSVKRLCDGEIFTVGDIIDTRVDNKYKQPILEINIKDNSVVFKTKLGFVVLYIAEKVKKPLFTTEDGVNIFEGDKFYELITPNFHNILCIWNILEYNGKSYIKYDQEGNRKNGRIWFSTKEKAEEYILMNKPCLSLKEVLEIVPFLDRSEKKLKELVKQKLNK